jgi:hypothetical protein
VSGVKVNHLANTQCVIVITQCCVFVKTLCNQIHISHYLRTAYKYFFCIVKLEKVPNTRKSSVFLMISDDPTQTGHDRRLPPYLTTKPKSTCAARRTLRLQPFLAQWSSSNSSDETELQSSFSRRPTRH